MIRYDLSVSLQPCRKLARVSCNGRTKAHTLGLSKIIKNNNNKKKKWMFVWTVQIDDFACMHFCTLMQFARGTHQYHTLSTIKYTYQAISLPSLSRQNYLLSAPLHPRYARKKQNKLFILQCPPHFLLWIVSYHSVLSSCTINSKCRGALPHLSSASVASTNVALKPTKQNKAQRRSNITRKI